MTLDLGTATFVSTGKTYDPVLLLDFLQPYLAEGFYYIVDFLNEIAVQFLSVSQPTPDAEDETSQVTTYSFTLFVPISDLLSFFDGDDYIAFINEATQVIVDYYAILILDIDFFNNVVFAAGKTNLTAINIVPAT